MYFASDNWAGAHPKIAASLNANATGYSPSYGAGDLDQKVREKFNTIFEREVSVFFTSTGTAANALALASSNKPGAVGFCHREAHIREDECGAPEFLAPGSRLRIVDGPDGKMSLQNLEAEIESVKDWGVMGGRPALLSLTQATEAGTLYSLDEIEALAHIGKVNKIPVHMDGARFANAIATLGCSPAEMTWKRGVDMLSFGGTKNGCWCAEALIFFDPAMAEDMPYIQKRSAQTFSKSRFVAAQFDAYLENGLWLELANHANQMAVQLEHAINKSSMLKIAWQRQANEVFAITKTDFAEQKLKQAGAHFYDWPAPYGMNNEPSADETIIRLVTSYATEQAEIDRFSALLE